MIRRTRDLITEVASRLDGFKRKGRLVFRSPIHQVLQGIYFDTSSYSKELFYPTVFAQPLFVPSDSVFFTYGGRLVGGGGRGWELGSENGEDAVGDVMKAIEQQALPFLDRMLEPIDFAVATEYYPAELPKEFRWPASDINVLEATAYAWFLSSNVGRSLCAIKRIESTFESERYETDWAQELLFRVLEFKKLLTKGDETRANHLLNRFRLDSANAIGVAEYLVEIE
jgi:hypothetical protein